jgi:hypothetical protein
MKTYYTAALDSTGDELTHRSEHDSAKAARAWIKEYKADARHWDQLAERDGFHREVASIALFADDEQISETATRFAA